MVNPGYRVPPPPPAALPRPPAYDDIHRDLSYRPHLIFPHSPPPVNRPGMPRINNVRGAFDFERHPERFSSPEQPQNPTPTPPQPAASPLVLEDQPMESGNLMREEVEAPPKPSQSAGGGSSSATFAKMHEVWEISEALDKLQQQQITLNHYIKELKHIRQQASALW